MISPATTGEAHAVRSERTLLRRWRSSDLEAFARMNANPKVMEHFEAPLSRTESDAQAAQFCDHIRAHGFGFWALEIPGVTEFAGFVGLVHVPFAAAFAPAVEIGWRLDHAYWGRGYASEAARGAAQFGFDALGLREIVAYTVSANVRSRAVMTRIGMIHDRAGDFDHPQVPAGHRLRPHVLYRRAAPALAGR
jgi:RimJ/RimL family protein N-acetyltransferase